MEPKISEYLYTQFGVAGLVVVSLAIVLFKLSADFAKLRTDLQQQVTRDLLNKRFGAYGQLWSKLRPLALYTDETLSPLVVRGLSKALSDWYFSAEGGLFLTVRAREFYFSLQDVLHVTCNLEGWKCDSRAARPEELFRTFVTGLLGENPDFRLQIEALKHPESIDPKVWRDLCKSIATKLESLAVARSPALNDSVFAVVQQVSSVLRSNLAYELHSRLEVHIPKP